VIFLRLIADRDKFTIGSNPVIVVAADGEPGVDRFRFSSSDGQAINAAVLIKQKKSSIASPIGRFEKLRHDVNSFSRLSRDVDRF
jgi:hypothetical protein